MHHDCVRNQLQLIAECLNNSIAIVLLGFSADFLTYQKMYPQNTRRIKIHTFRTVKFLFIIFQSNKSLNNFFYKQ